MFFNISDAADFRARHPLTSYEHYSALIRRVAAGEEKVIIAEKPLILAMTSGTSGSSCMLLSTKDTNTEFFMQVRQMMVMMSVLVRTMCAVHVNIKNKRVSSIRV